MRKHGFGGGQDPAPVRADPPRRTRESGNRARPPKRKRIILRENGLHSAQAPRSHVQHRRGSSPSPRARASTRPRAGMPEVLRGRHRAVVACVPDELGPVVAALSARRGIMPILTGCSSADRLKSAWGDRLPVEGGPSEGPIRASMGSWMSDSKGPRAAGGCSVERRASGPVAPMRLIAAGVAELRQHGDRDGSSNR